jgi:hypothetical protein
MGRVRGRGGMTTRDGRGSGNGSTESGPAPTCLTVVCAWCGHELRVVDGLGQTGQSHGICQDCAAAFWFDYLSEGER